LNWTTFTASGWWLSMCAQLQLGQHPPSMTTYPSARIRSTAMRSRAMSVTSCERFTAPTGSIVSLENMDRLPFSAASPRIWRFTAPTVRFRYYVREPSSAARLLVVSEHRVESLLREKEPFQRLAGVRREPEALRAARVRYDPERLEAEGEKVPGCGNG